MSDRKTDAQVIRERDNLEFLKRPNIWPRWPVLPLKKYVPPGSLDIALAAEDENFATNGKLRLYVGDTANMYLFKPEMPHELKTPEEIVADGWQVD